MEETKKTPEKKAKWGPWLKGCLIALGILAFLAACTAGALLGGLLQFISSGG